MPRLAPAVLLVSLALLACLPPAHAQAGANDPRISLTLAIGPQGPTVPLGGSQAFRVDVTVATTNLFCPGGATIDVALSLEDTGLAGVAGTLPASVGVPIRANLAPPAASATSGGNATATLQVEVAASAPPGHEHAFTVTATTPAEVPRGCQPVSTLRPSAATATAEVTLRTGSAAASGSSSTAATGNGCATATGTDAATCSGTQDAYFVPLPLEVGLLLAAGLVRRRRA